MHTAVSLHSWPRCESMYHKMFLDIMRQASKSYKPASSYIRDILGLKTERLLCDDCIDAKETSDMMELQKDFKEHIRTFIELHSLKGTIVCQFFFEFVVCILSAFLCSVSIFAVHQSKLHCLYKM